MTAAVKRTVCFVLPSLNGGGAERAAVQVLNALDADKWRRTMYLFRREGPYLSAVDPGIALVSGAGGSRWQRWQELRRFLRKTKPDLVVSISDPPATARAGDPLPITSVVKNQGLAPAGVSTTTKFWLVVGTTKKNLKGVQTIGPLAPGVSDSTGVALSVYSDTNPGTYSVLACADDDAATTCKDQDDWVEAWTKLRGA